MVHFKLITAEMDITEIHQLVDSYPTISPIDRNIDISMGAFDGKRLVGATSAVPTRYYHKRVLWSNFLVVDPEYRRQGIGFGLKQFQRSWALSHRYTTIVWAFDPFETSLAKFYFHDLGVIANTLRPISSENEIGGRTPYTLEVVWRLKDRHVKALATKKHGAHSLGSTVFALEVSEKGLPLVTQAAFDPEGATAYCMEIPLSTKKKGKDSILVTQEWYQALEMSLNQGFLKKYTISDFEIENGRYWYVLTAPIPWFLYVVECSDHTLYTGITPDLKRRIKLHNAGRGAAYTATRTPVQYLAAWNFPDRGTAIRAEIAFKRLSRERKLRHIQAKSDFYEGSFISNLL